jgi:branched-chain amino acid transport system permease protein
MRQALLWPLLAALICLFPLLVPPFYTTLAAYTGLAAIVTLGVVLLTGIGGQSSFGQATFVGIGAYSTAYLTKTLAVPPLLALPAALAATALVAWLLSLITVRLSGHFLALTSVAWGVSFFYLFGAVPFLGGYGGINDIPGLTFGGARLPDTLYAALIWLCLLALIALTRNLLDSRTGRAIRALPGGRVMAESMGIDTANTIRASFLIAALYAGLSGWLFAHFQRFVNPTPFSFNTSIDYVFMAIVGGAGHLWGAVLGAAVVSVLRDQLNDLLPRLLGQTGNYEGVVFALVVILLLHRAPGGLWPLLQRRLPNPKPPSANPTAAVPPRRAYPATSGAILEVTDVTKRFSGVVANNAVSFSVAPAEILALIGPNGAGKSTLFDLVSGVTSVTGGSIRLFGDPIDRLGARAIARRGLARTFQHVRLLPAMSVLENVALGAHLRGRAGILASMFRLDRAEEARLLAEASRQIARVGLQVFEHQPAGSLALGQQRIVEIARALCLDPALLLLDEPAAGLRLQEKQQLGALLARLRADGTAVLIVEHDMDFVMALADRIVVMDFGTKIAQGHPADIQANQAVLEAYLGGVA